MSRISVIVTTRDRPGPLTSCLQALSATFPSDAETIVVSDGGTAKLELEPFVEPLRLRCIVMRNGGPAAARNRGLAEAAGEIVAFTDDDCAPRPGWVEAVAAGVSTSPPRASGGLTVNGLRSNPYADAAQVIVDLVAAHDRNLHGSERFFPANNLAFPAEALRRLGGFDESFRTAEDRELCRRWLEAGYELRSTPEAVVEHRPALDFRAFIRQFAAYGRGAARFHAGHAGSLRESIDFHLRLPSTAVPKLAGCGLPRAAQLLALIGLWEVANLGGFLAGLYEGAGSNGLHTLESS